MARVTTIRLILFILIFICFYILYKLPYWRLEEAHDSDDDSYSSATTPHRNTSRILLVSSLFILSKSKHSKEDYDDWLRRFLGPITNEVYFYTSPSLVPTVQAARGWGLPTTIDANYSTPFDVPPLKGLEGWYNKMHSMDRENSYHSPELYSVWNAKPFFVDNAIKVMASKGKTYDYVFWNDGGSFRGVSVYKDWPDPRRVDEIWQEGSRLSGTKEEDLLFFPIQYPPYSARNWKEDMGPIDTDFSKGSFFGGSPSTMAWWARTFYAYHDYYVSKRLFVGKDQTVFNAVLVLFNERIITVWMKDPKAPAAEKFSGFLSRGNVLGSCGSEWFYYQFWLSNRQTRDDMRKIWLSEVQRNENARWWTRKPQSCRLTRVLALGSLLKRTFGEEWKAPVPTVVTPLRNWQY